MRVGMAAAALGTLLFAASQAAYAAPAVNLQGGVQNPGGSVDLVRQDGGGKGGGPGVRAGGGGGGPKISGQAGGPKMSGPRGGPKIGAYQGGPKMGGYKGGKPGAYAGRGPRGGDWARGAKRGGYAWKGDKRRHYGRYIYPGIGLGLAYGAYNYGDECGWLYRRAQATGSPYWWQRFEECRYSYY